VSRRRRHRRLLVPFLAVLAITAGTGIASAHELTVSAPGPVEVDLGDGSRARLVHATLTAGGDTLRAHVAPGDGTDLEALLLVPVFEPERSASRSELPRAHALVTGATRQFNRVTDEQVLLDDITSVEYRVLGTVRVDAAAELVVESSEPTRVALLVRHRDDAFVTEDPKRLQRTLVKLRAWTEVSATGQRRTPAKPISDGRGPAIYAAGLAVVALLLAAWWVRSGRTTSRRRGVERSGDGSGDAT